MPWGYGGGGVWTERRFKIGDGVVSVVATDDGNVGAIIMRDCMAEEEEEKSTGTASAFDVHRLELVNPGTPTNVPK